MQNLTFIIGIGYNPFIINITIGWSMNLFQRINKGISRTFNKVVLWDLNRTKDHVEQGYEVFYGQPPVVHKFKTPEEQEKRLQKLDEQIADVQRKLEL